MTHDATCTLYPSLLSRLGLSRGKQDKQRSDDEWAQMTARLRGGRRTGPHIPVYSACARTCSKPLFLIVSSYKLLCFQDRIVRLPASSRPVTVCADHCRRTMDFLAVKPSNTVTIHPPGGTGHPHHSHGPLPTLLVSILGVQ